MPFEPGSDAAWLSTACAASGASSSDSAGPETLFVTPLNRRRTSAAAVGLRASLPLKMTSSIFSPRRLLALCSPITQVMASATLLLPHPFGPTIAVTPLSKASSDRSEKDLNPLISRRCRRIDLHPGYVLKNADQKRVSFGAPERSEGAAKRHVGFAVRRTVLAGWDATDN